MESAYGIGVKNRYELFYDDEEDPLDIIKQREDEKKKKKETKQQQEKENKIKGPGPAPSKAKIIVPAKKGVKENPVKAQEPPVPRKDGDNNRTRSQKVQGERIVKFSGNVREENKDLEERKNRRNREDNKPERGPPSSEFRERGGFDRNSHWDGGNDRGTERERGDREPRSGGDSGDARRGRGGGGGGGGGGVGGGGYGVRGGGFRGRGGRGGRGGPGGGYDNRGKREFERQSGSDKRYNGIKAVDKREGGGSHNWGTIRDDMEHINNTAALSSDEAPEWAEKTEEATAEVQSDKEGGEQPVVVTAEGETDKPMIEDGPKIMTLDEWKKEQEKKRAVPQFNIRKAGEGEDSTQWKKTYVLKKKDEEEDTEELEEEDDEDVARRGRPKHVVDIEINYSDSRRGRGRGRGGPRGGSRGTGTGRGGFSRGTDGPGGPVVGSPEGPGVGAMGGDRGRGGNGGGGGVSREGSRGGRGGRGCNKNQSAPKVDDENDFPSLVAA